MHIPFVNFGAKSQPDSFDTHCVEILCLQHTLASLILQNPRLSRLSTFPCYVQGCSKNFYHPANHKLQPGSWIKKSRATKRQGPFLAPSRGPENSENQRSQIG